MFNKMSNCFFKYIEIKQCLTNCQTVFYKILKFNYIKN